MVERKKISDISFEVADFVDTQLAEFTKEPPKLIYHYTNADGAIGIISSGKIWGTHIGYLNDSSEFEYARDIILEAANDYWDINPKNKISQLLSEIRTRIIDYQNVYMNAWIACFCEQGDLLSQWRGYCKDRIGYSLGFYPALLSLQFKEKNEHLYTLKKVIYNRKTQKNLIIELFKKIDSIISRKLDGYQRVEIQSELFEPLLLIILDYLIIFKNSSFEEEQEWRLFDFGPQKDIAFRSTINSIIPYTPLDIRICDEVGTKGLPLAKIYIGGAGPKIRAKTAIEYLCDKYEYGDCEVVLTDIPLA